MKTKTDFVRKITVQRVNLFYSNKLYHSYCTIIIIIIIIIITKEKD